MVMLLTLTSSEADAVIVTALEPDGDVDTMTEGGAVSVEGGGDEGGAEGEAQSTESAHAPESHVS